MYVFGFTAKSRFWSNPVTDTEKGSGALISILISLFFRSNCYDIYFFRKFFLFLR